MVEACKFRTPRPVPFSPEMTGDDMKFLVFFWNTLFRKGSLIDEFTSTYDDEIVY